MWAPLGPVLSATLTLWGSEVSVGTSLIRHERRGHLTSLDGGRCEAIEYLLEQARAGLSLEVK